MTLKQMGALIILVGSIFIPIILICMLLGAACNGWEQSLIKKLLDILGDEFI